MTAKHHACALVWTLDTVIGDEPKLRAAVERLGWTWIGISAGQGPEESGLLSWFTPDKEEICVQVKTPDDVPAADVEDELRRIFDAHLSSAWDAATLTVKRFQEEVVQKTVEDVADVAKETAEEVRSTSLTVGLGLIVPLVVLMLLLRS